jgi:hypothetical protein
MDAADTLLSVTPSSFDISILEFLLPLVRGAQIVMASANRPRMARTSKAASATLGHGDAGNAGDMAHAS